MNNQPIVPAISYETIWAEKSVRFDLYPSDNFSNIPDAKQVYALVLNVKNHLLLVSSPDKKWTLPGGTVEPDESYWETLKREVYEESAVVIDEKTVQPLFFQRVFETDTNGNWSEGSTQIRYLCRVKTRDAFLSDPGGTTTYQTFVPLEKLPEYLLWGETTKFIQNLIRKRLQIKNG